MMHQETIAERYEILSTALKKRGWVELHKTSFELHPKGDYKPYYLNIERGAWRLKQFGTAPALAAWRRIDEKMIESIFRLCSKHAEKL